MSGLLGATLLLVADTVGRLVLASGELSVGIVLSVIGAPIFIFLARSLKRERAHAQN
ncbi:iron chelate uptake ABC transporter family permease subunit [Glutamicibacter uratoxydans]|uniref:iron chelate uptake ABC transporter family permease subunit n=1 Tax=Glutamicibacter uratoxydans TaxID=43667 RepID=UPI003D6FC8D0